MSKSLYLGVNSVARKIRKGYLGDGGVAHRVKKAYKGVGGVARPFLSTEGIEYYGNASTVSVGRRGALSARAGDYALFASGYISSPYTQYNYVDAYKSDLSKTTSNLSSARIGGVGVSFGSYGVFAGGYRKDTGAYLNTIEYFNGSLSRTNATNMRSIRSDSAGASTSSHVIIAGGRNGSTTAGTIINSADAYNTSFTRYAPPDLSFACSMMTGVSIDNKYAAFAAGVASGTVSYPNLIEAYDTSLTKHTLPALSFDKMKSLGMSVGGYGLLVGGSTITVEAYDSSLTKKFGESMGIYRSGGAGISSEKYGLVVGGSAGGTYSNAAEYYDTSLSRTLAPTMSTVRSEPAGSRAGNYMIVACGLWTNQATTSGAPTVTEVYQIMS